MAADSRRYDEAFCALALAIIGATVGRELDVHCRLPRSLSVRREKRTLELGRVGQDRVRCELMPSNKEDKPTPIDVQLSVDVPYTVRVMGGAYSLDAAAMEILDYLLTT